MKAVCTEAENVFEGELDERDRSRELGKREGIQKYLLSYQCGDTEDRGEDYRGHHGAEGGVGSDFGLAQLRAAFSTR